MEAGSRFQKEVSANLLMVQYSFFLYIFSKVSKLVELPAA